MVGAWSKAQRFTLNVPEFNRLPLHPQVNQITGEFASFTLVEIDHTRPESFAARGQRIQRQIWQAMNYRYVSGVRVLRELGRWRGGAAAAGAMPVVFTSMLVLDSLDAGTSPWATLGDEVFAITQTPQVWLDMQVYEQDGGLIFNWDAVEALFPPGMLDAMFDVCCRPVERLASDDTAWTAPVQGFLPATQAAQRLARYDNVAPISERLAQDFFIEQAVYDRTRWR